MRSSVAVSPKSAAFCAIIICSGHLYVTPCAQCRTGVSYREDGRGVQEEMERFGGGLRCRVLARASRLVGVGGGAAIVGVIAIWCSRGWS